MNQINYIRLINRAFINDNKDFNSLFELADQYGISIEIGNNGSHINGPYIDSIFLPIKKSISLDDFYSFIKSLSVNLDTYQGSFNKTFMEFSLKYSLTSGDYITNGDTQLVSYLSPEEQIEVYSLTEDDPPAIRIDPQYQVRSVSEYNPIIKEFFDTNMGVSNE